MTASNQEQALNELYKLSSQLVSLQGIDEPSFLTAIVESAAKALNTDIITLYTYDGKTENFGQPYFIGNILEPEHLGKSTENKGESVVKNILTKGNNNPTSLKSRFVEREKIQSTAAIPLIFGKDPVGVMFFNYRTPKTFTDEQKELITLFANQATIAIATMRLIHKTDSEKIKAQYSTCFVSYSSKDEDFAKKLYNDLQTNGVRCWFAPSDLKIGDRIRSRIDEMIDKHDKLLVILSKASITSQWVEQEIETALEKERKRKSTVLFPIRLDDFVMKSKRGWANFVRNTRNIGDFTEWHDNESYNQSLKRVLDSLQMQ